MFNKKVLMKGESSKTVVKKGGKMGCNGEAKDVERNQVYLVHQSLDVEGVFVPRHVLCAFSNALH